MPGIGVFVRWSVVLRGNIVSPDEKSSFKLYMYIEFKYVYI